MGQMGFNLLCYQITVNIIDARLLKQKILSHPFEKLFSSSLVWTKLLLQFINRLQPAQRNDFVCVYMFKIFKMIASAAIKYPKDSWYFPPNKEIPKTNKKL